MTSLSRPNVLVVMSDEQSYNTMGCTGNAAARTPQLDELAARGVVYDAMYTPFPLCCPSRTSLLTGLMPRHHHVMGNWRGIRPDLRSRGLGRWFADAGYHTFYVGKWHIPGTDPVTMGFQDAAAIPAVVEGKDRGRYIPEYRDYAQAKGHRLLPDNNENLTAADVANLRSAHRPHRGTATIPLHDYLESWQTRRFVETLGRSPADKPWFGVCSYNAPHFPMVVPPPYDTLIDRQAIALPASWHIGSERLPGEVRRSRFARHYSDLDEEGWVDLVAHYYGMISLVDDQVGAILRALTARGETGRTIVVFVSDHGDMMGAHRLMEKGHYLHYEEAVHLPMIVAHPDGPVCPGHAGRDAGFHSMVDIAPALADWAGVSPRDEVDGIGLEKSRDHVIAETLLWRHDSENAHGAHCDPADLTPRRDALNLSIRDSNFRYIYRSEDRDELFDEQGDPGEVDNLVENCPELASRYRRRLTDEVSDVFSGFLSAEDAVGSR